jgi:hypothetical protein
MLKQPAFLQQETGIVVQTSLEEYADLSMHANEVHKHECAYMHCDINNNLITYCPIDHHIQKNWVREIRPPHKRINAQTRNS